MDTLCFHGVSSDLSRLLIMKLLMIITYILCNCCYVYCNQYDFNGCNIMIYRENGMFSAKDTLLECAAQMGSPTLPVSYDKNYEGNLTVNIQLVSR